MPQHTCGYQRRTCRCHLFSSSMCTDPGSQTQVVWLGRKHLYPLSYLASPGILSDCSNLVVQGVLFPFYPKENEIDSLFVLFYRLAPCPNILHS